MNFRQWMPLVGLVISMATYAHADDPNQNRQVDLIRQAYCAARGGDDISSAGTFQAGAGVAEVVACRMPASPQASAANADPAPMITLPPFTYVGAALYPPTGTVTVAASNPVFNTSCAADIFVKSVAGFPAVSHGTSTINCRGYNAHGVVNGCSVDWSGPTDVTIGAEPYGGHVVVAFTCLVLGPGAFGTAMNLKYLDPTNSAISYSRSDVAGLISVTVQ